MISEGVKTLYSIFLAKEKATIDIASMAVDLALINIMENAGMSREEADANLKAFIDYPEEQKYYYFKKDKPINPNYSNFKGGVFKRVNTPHPKIRAMYYICLRVKEKAHNLTDKEALRVMKKLEKRDKSAPLSAVGGLSDM